MLIDRKAVQDRLKNFDFSGLFTQELGWEWHTTNVSVTVDATQFKLEPVAHKRGMVAYGYTQAWVDFLIEKLKDPQEWDALFPKPGAAPGTQGRSCTHVATDSTGPNSQKAV